MLPSAPGSRHEGDHDRQCGVCAHWPAGRKGRGGRPRLPEVACRGSPAPNLPLPGPAWRSHGILLRGWVPGTPGSGPRLAKGSAGLKVVVRNGLNLGFSARRRPVAPWDAKGSCQGCHEAPGQGQLARVSRES